jgi:hypothetical protein
MTVTWKPTEEEDAMSLQRRRAAAVTLVLPAIIAAALFAVGGQAAAKPLRSGTVITKMDVGDYTFIKAIDDADKEFWVLITICTIGARGKIDVLAGTRYSKMQTKEQVIMEDVYLGQLVRIGDVEVTGFGPDKLPDGCVLME